MHFIIWFFQGALVGFGAILPGVSGGTLCTAFGMYYPIIEMLSHPKTGLKKYWLMTGIFILGGAAGFVGLSGLAGVLLEKNTPLITCIFIGFIIGTIPQLWSEAGEKGRNSSAYAAMCVGFIIMIAVLTLLKSQTAVTVSPGFGGYFFCGVLWGLSFIVPGLSSSSLLLFFGLYQPMLDGIYRIDFSVLIPMAIGMILCVSLLSKLVHSAYEKYHAVISHLVIGIVAATTVMIFPLWNVSVMNVLSYVLCIVGVGMLSYYFTRICNKLKAAC